MTYKTEDLIVPLVLRGEKSCKIEIEITAKTVSLQIGPRDIVWDRKTGEVTDAGTWMGG